MIDPTDPVLLLLILSSVLAIMLILSFIDHFSVVRELQGRNRFLESILNEKCPDWRDGFSETVYPKRRESKK